MGWRGDQLTEEELKLVEWCRLPGGLATPLSRLVRHLARILAEKDEQHPANAQAAEKTNEGKDIILALVGSR